MERDLSKILYDNKDASTRMHQEPPIWLQPLKMSWYNSLIDLFVWEPSGNMATIYHSKASSATGKISRTGRLGSLRLPRQGQSSRSFQLPCLPPHGILMILTCAGRWIYHSGLCPSWYIHLPPQVNITWYTPCAGDGISLGAVPLVIYHHLHRGYISHIALGPSEKQVNKY